MTVGWLGALWFLVFLGFGVLLGGLVMAKIGVICESIMLCREAGVTPFVYGHRGLGKSSVIRQLAESNGFGFIDLRCSQLEASDIRGLPDRVDGRTAYLPPRDLPVADLSDAEVEGELAKVVGCKVGDLRGIVAGWGDDLSSDLGVRGRFYQRRLELQPRFSRGFLFLDEVNRAQDDVLQSIFELVLDRRVGLYSLPPGWSIVAAGNFMEGYRVGGFDDPAFLNRFCHMVLSAGESTVEEWVHYMASKHGSHASSVIEFATQNMKHLDGDIQGELGFSIQPSRRSWEWVIKVSEAAVRLRSSQEALQNTIGGLVGLDLASAFIRYSCPVKPRDILNNGVGPYKDALRKLSRNELGGLMWGMISYVKGKMGDEKTAVTCLDFAEHLVANVKDNDLVVAFCRALVSDGNSDSSEQSRAAVISNPQLAALMAQQNKKQGRAVTFLDRLVERPALQKALSKVAWGSE